MPNLSFQNPLACAISFIFKGNAGVRVLSYTDRQTFSDLWHHGLEFGPPKIAGHELHWSDEDAVLLIAGEDPPDAILEDVPECLKGITFRDYFTASSWLAAWKIKFEAENISARAVVIDPCQTGPSGSTAQTLQMLFCARDDDGLSLIAHASTMSSPSLEALCARLRKMKDNPPHTSTEKGHGADVLRAVLWNGLTANREINHAISNVLGALLLARETRGVKANLSDLERVLERLVQVLLDLPMRNDSLEPWWKASKEPSFSHIALIDDMAELWSPFLRGAVGFSETEHGGFLTLPKASFQEAISTFPLRLTNFLATKASNLSTNDLFNDCPDRSSNFILFLNLRLFPIVNTHSDEPEAKSIFTKNLSKFGLKLLDSGRNLPWLDADGQKRLRAELANSASGNCSRSSDTEELNLPPQETMLPRLLALLDPTLPIVIFSSTHRSELIDPFRDYGNIIITFRKPILTDIAQDWIKMVGELRGDFISALELATKILRVRYNLGRLEIAQPVSPGCKPRNGNCRIIEIYIDESGDPFSQMVPGFAVGGIIIQHESQDAQNTFHKTINQSPKKWGVPDHTPDRVRANEVAVRLPAISYFPKKPTANGSDEKEGLAFVSSALGKRSQMAAFALIEPDLLRFNFDNRLDSAILFDRNSLDNIYHHLLRTNLEMLLFEHPWSDLSCDAFHIHVATRDQWVNHDNTRKIWQRAYGIQFRPRQERWYYTSLGGDSVCRLIRELLLARNALDGRPNIVMARAVTLNDYEQIIQSWKKDGQTPRVNSQLYDPTRLDPKQIHYLADWIVRMALYRTDNLPVHAKAWFTAGYVQVMSEECEALLSACRMKKRDEAIDSLSRLPLTTVNNIRMSMRAERYLRQKVSTWPRTLNANQFFNLFRR